MNGLPHDLQKLARAARRETPPPINVAGKVMARIAERGGEEDPSLNWIAALAAAAAVVLALSLLPVYSNWHDPMVAMVAQLSWGLL